MDGHISSSFQTFAIGLGVGFCGVLGSLFCGLRGTDIAWNGTITSVSDQGGFTDGGHL